MTKRLVAFPLFFLAFACGAPAPFDASVGAVPTESTGAESVPVPVRAVPTDAPKAVSGLEDAVESPPVAVPVAPMPTADAVGDADSVEEEDGPIERLNDRCPKYGRELSSSFGRLDGELVAISLPNRWGRGCRHDRTHVHLVVRVESENYDVAVNVDSVITQTVAQMPGGAWSEGWHTSMHLDYPSMLGVHSHQFKDAGSIDATALHVEEALAKTRRISVFATGYGPDGAHEVHRRGYHDDGAIVINPQSKASKMLLFSFERKRF